MTLVLELLLQLNHLWDAKLGPSMQQLWYPVELNRAINAYLHFQRQVAQAKLLNAKCATEKCKFRERENGSE